MPQQKKNRFSRRADPRKATGIGVSKEELDEVSFTRRRALANLRRHFIHNNYNPIIGFVQAKRR